MTRKTRVILAIVVVEILLAGLWYFLTVAAATGSSQPDAARTIGETMGTAMGGLLGLGFVLFLMAAKADRANR